MYKRIVSAILSAVLVLCCAGCVEQSSIKDVETAADTEFVEEEKNKKKDTAQVYIKDEAGLLDENQKKLFYDYGLCYAETLKNMQPADISQFYADSKSEECFVNNTAFKTLTAVRGLSEKDLSLEYVTVEYRVENATDIGNAVKVVIWEDNTQKFRHIKGESLTCNTYHEFVIVPDGGEWLIKSHIHEEDFYLLTRTAWDDAKGADYSEKSADTVNLLVADARENYLLKNENLNDFQEIAVNRQYNREKAVEYAQQWYNKRNSEYLEYDLYGGNCQNFASQCIHAGEMDMDIKGTYTCQWKFYGKDLNYSQVPQGRSYSWIGVDEFYSYAQYNRHSGLITQPDISLEFAQKGDVIQVGAYHKWHHSLVVTEVLTDENGSCSEILLASNTADRWNYPLSAYIYTYPRLIHIDGQI